MEDLQVGENVQDWLARLDVEEALRRKDFSHLDGLPRDERERRIRIGREIEARVAARPSPYEQRLAEANAGEEERMARAARSALDARREALAAADSDSRRERSAQRLAIAKLLVDERERAHERELKLEQRIAEIELRFEQRLDAAEAARADAERGGKAAEARAQRLEDEVAEAQARLRDDVVKIADDACQRVRDMKPVIAAELRDEIASRVDAKIALTEKLIEKQHNLSSDDVRRIIDAAISADRERQQDRFTALMARSSDQVGATINDKIDAKIAPIERFIEKQHNLSTNDVRQIVTNAVNEVAKIERAERDRAIDALADDLRQRVGNMKTAISAELRSETVATVDAKAAAFVERLEAKVTTAEEHAEAAEDRTRALETTVAELRGRVGGDEVLRQRPHDDLEAVAAFNARVAALEQRAASRSDFSVEAVRKIATDVAGEAVKAERVERDRVIDSIAAGLRSESAAMAHARIVPIEKLIEKQYNLSADDVGRIVDAAISAENEKQRHDRDQAIASAVEEARRADKADIADLERRLRDTAGEAPQVRTWSPSAVFYRGQYVTHAGALYQARRDVASTPMSGSDDWQCVTRAGRDGEDGRSIVPRGEYAASELYAKGDIVGRAGSGWIALRDKPGVLGESEDWMLTAACGPQGKTGKTGPRGDKGEKGDTVRLHSWQSDAPRYRVSGLLEDGTVLPSIELRPLFEQYLLETSG